MYVKRHDVKNKKVGGCVYFKLDKPQKNVTPKILDLGMIISMVVNEDRKNSLYSLGGVEKVRRFFFECLRVDHDNDVNKLFNNICKKG